MAKFKPLFVILAVMVGLVGLKGCGGRGGPDLHSVLERTVGGLLFFDEFMTANGIDVAGDEDMHELARTLAAKFNAEPKIWKTRIGVNIFRDSTIEGYQDTNQNARQDEGEPQLFTVEIDADNGRLIATRSSGDTLAHPLGDFAKHLFAGGMMKKLLALQLEAGFKVGHFDDREVPMVEQSYYFEKPQKNAKDGDNNKSG